MALPITAIFAGLLALWLTYLQFRVVRFRRGNAVSLGDGGHEDGIRAIRAHGNAVETVPVFLILLALAEGLATPAPVLIGLGAMFLTGRVLHGQHFARPRKGFAMRFYGMIMTLIPTVLLALGLIAHAALGGGA